MNHVAIDGPDAPWNERELPEREIEVAISLTLRKTMKLPVTDYKIITDGQSSCEDFSECNLYNALDNITLPQDLAGYMERISKGDIPKHLKEVFERCKDWEVDELLIIPE